MRLALIGAQRPPEKRMHTFSRYIKPSGNKSLHRPGHKMVCDRNFFGCFTPYISPQSSTDDVAKLCLRTFSRYHMKLGANDSSHRTDYEMVCDRNFVGCFTPGRSPQSSSYDVEATL